MPEALPNESTDSTPPSDDPAEPPEAACHPATTWAGPGCDIALGLEVPDPDPPLIGWLVPMLRRIAEEAGVTRGRLGLRVVGDEEMASLHERFSHVTGTTDVLTFDLRDHPDNPDEPIEGDIVICLDEAQRQAEARTHDTRSEVLLYAVHGLLHLLGEDDHEPADYDRMHRREDELLQRIGLDPVFLRGESEGSA